MTGPDWERPVARLLVNDGCQEERTFEVNPGLPFKFEDLMQSAWSLVDSGSEKTHFHDLVTRWETIMEVVTSAIYREP
jgi:hypothetical protein